VKRLDYRGSAWTVKDRERSIAQRETILYSLNKGAPVDLYQLMADVAAILTKLSRLDLSHRMTTETISSRLDRLEDFVGLGQEGDSVEDPTLF
jgi:predicted transcriptional regulator